MKCYFSILFKGKIFFNQQQRKNYQKGIPLLSEVQNQVKEFAQDYSFLEAGRRLHISRGAVRKIVKQYNLTESTASKKLNPVHNFSSRRSTTYPLMISSQTQCPVEFSANFLYYFGLSIYHTSE